MPNVASSCHCGATYRVGSRVELSPACDLWMRGARFGEVQRIKDNGHLMVRMDHPQVRRLQEIPVYYTYHKCDPKGSV